ncbi:hypothetical protein A3D09_02660 [Candidatus Collierbacteria bacterium RIFCSPHIGHO2_02_FULL_49_10]|uniref:Uncharacterized protein n=1 Tax=Candidatus Collierbacteria bacterium RIFCSPHIGHO2_02_FULL_49_10 TaxID=1817723 RepID=A0A1F5EVT2_9BACT|nr:MAG: hypothetical protein A3D09_02660 [Candidatus Collierbacteria bacterium RIFCSPHIGHO2_02_FULL_49_10]
MASGNEHVGATRLLMMETFFDPRLKYSLEDWLFRVYSYYEMILCMTGPDGVSANEHEMGVMLATLNLIHWAEELPPDCLIGYDEVGEDGGIHPYAIAPKPTYLM